MLSKKLPTIGNCSFFLEKNQTVIILEELDIQFVRCRVSTRTAQMNKCSSLQDDTIPQEGDVFLTRLLREYHVSWVRWGSLWIAPKKVVMSGCRSCCSSLNEIGWKFFGFFLE